MKEHTEGINIIGIPTNMFLIGAVSTRGNMKPLNIKNGVHRGFVDKLFKPGLKAIKVIKKKTNDIKGIKEKISNFLLVSFS